MSKPILRVIHGNNLEVLDTLQPNTFKLIYMDPPFNTGKKQKRKPLKFISSEDGDRVGFKGKTYKVEAGEELSYSDSFDNLSDFLRPRIEICKTLLTSDGSILVHLDYREVHDVKVFVMDSIFGKECFKNEIIWAYDYGAKPKNRWPAKHDTILWYTKDPDNYIFNFDQVDRVPYMAPGLVTPEKLEKGKIITDVWWNTIVCGKEKTGYPTQKPIAILNRFVKVNSNQDDWLLDPFAGSGSFGDAAIKHNRNCVLIDENLEAIKTIKNRFDNSFLYSTEFI